MREFALSVPCAFSELVHFRKRIGEKGIDLIFQESIRVNNHDDEDHHHDTVFIDSNVQEKNVAYPTDVKLHKKIVKKVLGIVKKIGLIVTSVSGTIPRTEKRPSGRRCLRTIAGRVVREQRRNFKGNYDYDKLLGIFETILFQRRMTG